MWMDQVWIAILGADIHGSGYDWAPAVQDRRANLCGSLAGKIRYVELIEPCRCIIVLGSRPVKCDEPPGPPSTYVAGALTYT